MLIVSTFTKGNANSPSSSLLEHNQESQLADTVLVTLVFVLLWYVQVNITPLVSLVTGNLEHKGLMSGGWNVTKGLNSYLTFLSIRLASCSKAWRKSTLVM